MSAYRHRRSAHVLSLDGFQEGPGRVRPTGPLARLGKTAAHRARGCYYTAELRFSFRPCGRSIPTRRRACANSGLAAGIWPGNPAPDHADGTRDGCPRARERERHRIALLPVRPPLPRRRPVGAGGGRRPQRADLARRHLPIRPPRQAPARGDDQVVPRRADRRGGAAHAGSSSRRCRGAGRLGRRRLRARGGLRDRHLQRARWRIPGARLDVGGARLRERSSRPPATRRGTHPLPPPPRNPPRRPPPRARPRFRPRFRPRLRPWLRP